MPGSFILNYEKLGSFSPFMKNNRKRVTLTPENTPHTQNQNPEDKNPAFTPMAPSDVESDASEFSSFAHTMNGGVPPYTQGYPYQTPITQQGMPVPNLGYPQTYPAIGYFQPMAQNPQTGFSYPSGNPQPTQNPTQINERDEQQASSLYNQYLFGYPGFPQQGFQGDGVPPMAFNPTLQASQPSQISYVAIPQTQQSPEDTEPQPESEEEVFDYDFITSPARIAIYDNLKTAPRVIQIQGAPTHEYIERIASLTYKHAKEEGGIIPYTVIREVSENFIHARFQEIVVSIMDKGNTIRFADQGPGISNKDLVQEPGFSSAIEPMKRYIRGVGSGLPIVRDYLDTTHGYIEIEDNINKGSVVTISLVASRSIHDEVTEDLPELTENERKILQALLPDKALGITEMNHLTGIPVASIHTAFSKMEENGLVEKVNKKRALTIFGERVAISL